MKLIRGKRLKKKMSYKIRVFGSIVEVIIGFFFLRSLSFSWYFLICLRWNWFVENGISSGNGKEIISRIGNIYILILFDNLFIEFYILLFMRKKLYFLKSSII